MTYPRFISKHLRDANNVYNFVGDYSVTPTTAFYVPEHGAIANISNLVVLIEDELSTGIAITLSDDRGNVTSLTADENIKTNADWTKYAFDIERKAWGVGNEYIVARWNFETFSKKLSLEGRFGERLNVILNDDFSNLVNHNFLIQGHHRL